MAEQWNNVTLFKVWKKMEPQFIMPSKPAEKWFSLVNTGISGIYKIRFMLLRKISISIGFPSLSEAKKPLALMYFIFMIVS